MTIAPLSPADGDRVFQIYESAQAAAKVPIGPNWSREQIQSELSLSLGLWASPTDPTSLCAFIFYRDLPDAFEITMLATAIGFHRQGAMIELIRLLQTEAGVRSKAIWLEVHELNLPARKLYEKTGFREVGRRSRYYSDNGAAVLYSWG